MSWEGNFSLEGAELHPELRLQCPSARLQHAALALLGAVQRGRRGKSIIFQYVNRTATCPLGRHPTATKRHGDVEVGVGWWLVGVGAGWGCRKGLEAHLATGDPASSLCPLALAPTGSSACLSLAQPGSAWLSLAHVPLRFYRRENPLLDTSHYGPYPRELI